MSIIQSSGMIGKTTDADLCHFLSSTKRLREEAVEIVEIGGMLDAFSLSASGLYWRAWALFVWPLLCGHPFPHEVTAKSYEVLRANLEAHPWPYFMAMMSNFFEDSLGLLISDISKVKKFDKILTMICAAKDRNSYHEETIANILIGIISTPGIKRKIYDWAKEEIQARNWRSIYILNAVLSLMVKRDTSLNAEFVKDIFTLYYNEGLMGDYLVGSSLSHVILNMNHEFLNNERDYLRSRLTINIY